MGPTRRSVAIGLGGLSALGLSVGQARAHRLDEALSVLDINSTSPLVDLTHQLYAHDLEHAFGVRSVGMDWFESPIGVARLQAYSAEMFTIARGAGEVVPFRFLGVEISGDLVFVYADVARAAIMSDGQPVELTVWSGLLHDYSAGQNNLVNLRLDGRTTSLAFAAGDGPRRVTLN